MYWRIPRKARRRTEERPTDSVAKCRGFERTGQYSEKWHRLLLAVLALAVVWVVADLLSSRRSDLREFDPNEVARLETDMSRSYYERRQVTNCSRVPGKTSGPSFIDWYTIPISIFDIVANNT